MVSPSFIHNNLAWTLYRLGDAARGEPHARKAMMEDPENLPAIGTAAHIAFALGRPEEALDLFRRAMVDANDPEPTSAMLAQSPALLALVIESGLPELKDFAVDSWVGLLAPALLVVLRLIQGFAVAGEISGASSMILEHAPEGRRGFFSSFTLQGVQAGQILAAAVFLPLAHYMPADAFNSWGWRIPFLLSFIVLVAGWIIRREVAETPAFDEEKAQGELPRAPVVQAVQGHWRDMLRVVCMALMNVIPVVATIFGAAYAVQPGYGIGFEKDVYLWIPVLGNIVGDDSYFDDAPLGSGWAWDDIPYPYSAEKSCAGERSGSRAMRICGLSSAACTRRPNSSKSAGRSAAVTES